jgi:hypothetical protein
MEKYQESIQVDLYWLPTVEQALVLRGFVAGPQQWKPGQYSGWIKELEGGYQLHVRLFKNGIIQPEWEVGWQFVEHPGTSWAAINPVKEVLNQHGIPYHVVYTERYTANGHIPGSRTPWLAVLALVVLGVLVVKAATSRQ